MAFNEPHDPHPPLIPQDRVLWQTLLYCVTLGNRPKVSTTKRRLRALVLLAGVIPTRAAHRVNALCTVGHDAGQDMGQIFLGALGNFFAAYPSYRSLPAKLLATFSSNQKSVLGG